MSGAGRRAPLRARPDASMEAKKLAALVLEGLAGVRTPTQAAQAAGISVQRYYVVEARALQAVVSSMEPRRRGRQKGPEAQLASAVKEKERVERELRRAQALLRCAQRVIGVAPAAEPSSGKIAAAGKRRARRPAARAVKAVAILRASEEAKPPSTLSETS